MINKNEKISLEELALAITARNIEKNKEKQKEINIKRTRNKNKKSGFNLIKNDDGSIICFIPENMSNKGMNRKIENNIDIITEFKNSNDKVLKL